MNYFAGLITFSIKSIFDFLNFWYIRGSKDFWRDEINFLRSTEREMGLLINLKLITQPIYGDYSYMGRFLGPIFRLSRVCISFFVLLISFLVIILLYIARILIVPVALYMVISNILQIL